MVLLSNSVWLPREMILYSKRQTLRLFNHSDFHSRLHGYRKHGVCRLLSHKEIAVRWGRSPSPS
ncbi:eukaryotic translation initiation factor 1B (predicted), isoform CRA_a [Rattus norvegicus]|uniref:Eukaryotic translation initiation factor 1B (Predicted), isoform CRA_a n=1 Tax=Rattus norvegicus TaxID=10116 RepID=A6I413_RAT|nr:eukaryotic translation initiation factor 1B (predicted), isoform CRA_a [Rattus norvegicus]